MEQLSAVFRTPTLVAKTYFAAREMEQEERERLRKQKAQIKEKLAMVRKQALDLMSPNNNMPGKNDMLAGIGSINARWNSADTWEM